MSDAKDNKPKSRKPVKILIALFVIASAGAAIWYFLIRTPPAPHNLIKLSGRIEGDDTTVATKAKGDSGKSNSARLGLTLGELTGLLGLPF